MSFNNGKCHVLHLGRTNPKHVYKMNNMDLAVTEEERDLGVLISSSLKVGRQCEKAAMTATGVLAQILRGFSYRNRDVLPGLYRTYVRPHLEYPVTAWSPWQIGDCERLENVQKRMVAAVSGLKGKTYEEKLKEIGMETLAERRRRLDLLQTFKILNKKEDVEPETWFRQLQADRGARTRMRGGGVSLALTRSRLELRRNFYSQRVVGPWNRLQGEVRLSKTVNEFKRKVRK